MSQVVELFWILTAKVVQAHL